MTHPTLHAALTAAQASGYTHAEFVAFEDSTLEPEERLYPIADAVGLMAVPGQVPFEGVPACDPDGPYLLQDGVITDTHQTRIVTLSRGQA